LLVRVFGVPALLALATLFGLLSALLGQGGVWHVLAWIAPILPLGVLVWHLIRSAQGDVGRTRPGRRRRRMRLRSRRIETSQSVARWN